MNVILLESVENVGGIGDVVKARIFSLETESETMRTESTSLQDMLKVAKTAANIANDPVTFNQGELIEKTIPNYYKITQKWEDSSIEEKIPYVQKLNDRLFELDE